MNPIRFAVVGCGNIGRRHAAVVAAEPRAKLVVACDVAPGRAEAVASANGGGDATTSFEEVLRRSDVDIINICTPHAMHAPMSMAAAAAKKHVLVEKPMALRRADALAMIEAAKQNDVKLMVVKQNRYNVPITLTKNALDQGKLGRIFMVQCNVLWNRLDEYYKGSDWRGRKATEGGALYTQASHFLDLLVWWFGDVVSVKADVGTKNHSIEIEDCGNALLTFGSGVMGTLCWTTCVYNKNYEGSITIIGEHGTIKVGGPYLNRIETWDVRSYPLPDDIRFDDKPNQYGTYQGSSSNHPRVIEDVIAALLQQSNSIVDGPEGLRSLDAIEQVYGAAGYALPV